MIWRITIDSYIYSFKDIVRSLIGKLCFANTKSKIINPNIISTGMNCAGWEDSVISWCDAEYIVNLIYDTEKQYIIYATVNDYTEEEIAQELCCNQSTINRNKHKIESLLRSLQTV